jgi:HEAT repeat protein
MPTGKTGDPRAVDVLLDLLDDETVSTDAIIGLGKMGDPAALPALGRFLTHPDSRIRDEAKKAIPRINRDAKRKQEPGR